MAAILTLLSGLVGLFAALLAYLLLDMSALASFAIWSLSGITLTFLAIALAGLPRVGRRDDPRQELA